MARYPLRRPHLRKSPAFVATAVLTLGLGIGATTSVFSLCDAMLWKPVPLPRLDTLVLVLEQVPDSRNEWNDVTPADLEDIQRYRRGYVPGDPDGADRGGGAGDLGARPAGHEN